MDQLNKRAAVPRSEQDDDEYDEEVPQQPI
jgi:hypothetical protein